VLVGSRDRVAAEEVGARAGLGGASALLGDALAEREVIPMVIDDGLVIGHELEALEQQLIHRQDGRAVGLRHLVATLVEIADVLDADAVGVGTFDAGRDLVEAAADHDAAIGEGGEVLRDLRKAAFQMRTLHALAQRKVVVALKMSVAGDVGVVLLDQPDAARDLLVGQPFLKLIEIEENKFTNDFHKRVCEGEKVLK